MTVKQYIHRKKPGGYQKLVPGQWLTLSLPPTASNSNGILIHKLYVRLEWEPNPNRSAHISGFRVRYRLVRKAGKGKAADPTGYDERTILFDSENVATHSIEYVGPVRKGEVGRPYYWQMMVIPQANQTEEWIKNLRVTTRYTDFWRMV